MKLTLSNSNNKLRRQGFTLIEMIGVLAVIAILAALLIPKVFQAINDARVNNTAVSIHTVKTAIADHYGKYNSLNKNGVTGADVAGNAEQWQYDRMLLNEGLLEKIFSPKIGDGIYDDTHTRIELVSVAGQAAATSPTAPNQTAHSVGAAALYDLDASGTGNDTTGSYVLQAIVTGVLLEDAKALNRVIDGTVGETSAAGAGATSTLVTTSDFKGRVKYEYTSAEATTTVYVYITHR